MKPHLGPFVSRIEKGTRVGLFLTTFGYSMIAIIAAKCNTTYNQILETTSGIREVVYVNGSHAHVNYAKVEKESIEKIKIEKDQD